MSSPPIEHDSYKWKEVLQVDLGKDERTCTDRAVQWEQRSREFETSRGTLPDVVNDAIFTERSPPAIRTHLSVTAKTRRDTGQCVPTEWVFWQRTGSLVQSRLVEHQLRP